MATKHGKMVTQRYELPPINSHNPLNIKPCKYYIFTIAMLRVTRLTSVVT